MKTFPELASHQYAVGRAELATGHVLKRDGSLFQQDEDFNEIFDIFNSLEEAKAFAELKTELNPELECWIINAAGITIYVFDKNGERSL